MTHHTSMVMGRPRTATYTDDIYCDSNLMVRRINEVRNYFERITPTCRKTQDGFLTAEHDSADQRATLAPVSTDGGQKSAFNNTLLDVELE